MVITLHSSPLLDLLQQRNILAEGGTCEARVRTELRKATVSAVDAMGLELEADSRLAPFATELSEVYLVFGTGHIETGQQL